MIQIVIIEYDKKNNKVCIRGSFDKDVEGYNEIRPLRPGNIMHKIAVKANADMFDNACLGRLIPEGSGAL